MSADVAVSDASPLIALYQIGHLELLRTLFDHVIVPRAVMQEVAPSVGALPRWVHRQQSPLPPDLARHLDVREREAIALAVHLVSNGLNVSVHLYREILEAGGEADA